MRRQPPVAVADERREPPNHQRCESRHSQDEPSEESGGLYTETWWLKDASHRSTPRTWLRAVGTKASTRCAACGLNPSDRFLLYTDSVTETENAAYCVQPVPVAGRQTRLQPASELSRQVLSELRRWRPAAVNQQDDITLIVVDVL
jgi:Stage II sporulation protein E (SpoIIE)